MKPFLNKTRILKINLDTNFPITFNKKKTNVDQNCIKYLNTKTVGATNNCTQSIWTHLENPPPSWTTEQHLCLNS